MPNNNLYRPCVGAMIINQDGMIWMGKRINKVDYQTNSLWQMPQGGIDEGEEPDNAVIREVYEETGIKKIQIIKKTNNWYNYDIPKEILANMNSKYVGQTQQWFLLSFEGTDDEINLIPPLKSKQPQEFIEWKWENPENILNMVIDFKRETYRQVLAEFKNYLSISNI